MPNEKPPPPQDPQMRQRQIEKLTEQLVALRSGASMDRLRSLADGLADAGVYDLGTLTQPQRADLRCELMFGTSLQVSLQNDTSQGHNTYSSAGLTSGQRQPELHLAPSGDPDPQAREQMSPTAAVILAHARPQHMPAPAPPRTREDDPIVRVRERLTAMGLDFDTEFGPGGDAA